MKATTRKKAKTSEEKLNLDSILFKCRDILRQARNSGSFFEKRDMMLTLVFLRFIGEKFEDGVENLRKDLAAQGCDLDDPAIKAAFLDDPTFTDGTYNLLPEARWSTIINTPAPGLNVALDTALHSIAANSKALKGCFVEGTFTTRNLASNDIKKLVDEVNKISHKAFGEEKDLIGRVYEYFLKEFAVNATKEEGEYYTPHDVVQLIAAMIEPFDGTLYDPCCGSGGMFIQSAELVKAKRGDISRINIYGQEKEPATYRLAKMNLALRGISHNLGDEADSSFSHDLHKGLYFNYIMANPPFNLKGWYNENLKNDARWADYTTPPESNANYAWILHILSHLKPFCQRRAGRQRHRGDPQAADSERQSGSHHHPAPRAVYHDGYQRYALDSQPKQERRNLSRAEVAQPRTRNPVHGFAYLVRESGQEREQEESPADCGAD